MEKKVKLVANTDIAGEHIDTDNEYMYYYSVEFINSTNKKKRTSALIRWHPFDI